MKSSWSLKCWLKDAGSSPALGANKFYWLMKNDIEIGAIIAMVLTDTPLGIQVGRRHLFIYPQTLGKMYLTAPLIKQLGIKDDNLKLNPLIEALRVVEENRSLCCKLIAYHTLQKKSDMLSSRILKARENIIFKFCDNDDIATLLITILSDNKLHDIITECGIDKEAERMEKINQAKDSSNQYIFGGRTIWGSLIDAACERYKWTLDYVLWEISYNNLTLMMKDKITSIYLSDEERKKAHIPSATEKVFSGDNKEDIMEMIRQSEENPI